MATKNIGMVDFGFSLIGVQGATLQVETVFFPVVKLPVDIKNTGLIGADFHENGVDNGAEFRPSKTPNPPQDLPPGIVEVYKA
jgi:hypothetical protein